MGDRGVVIIDIAGINAHRHRLSSEEEKRREYGKDRCDI
jgi:hypothetical protein